MTLEINYGDHSTRPCPNPDFPLHHFAFRQTKIPANHEFQCTAPECGVYLNVEYTAPVISDEDLELLTNEESLKRRYEAAVARDATRAGLRLASPATTLWKLRRYIRDALKPDSAGKKIPAINKRFLESFGDECNELLTRLGFRFVVSTHHSLPGIINAHRPRLKMKKRSGTCHRLHRIPTDSILSERGYNGGIWNYKHVLSALALATVTSIQTLAIFGTPQYLRWKE